jgi:hypothetical protein
MSRAERRLQVALDRPKQRFMGELQVRAVQRAYQEQMRAQMEREANGEPISPEIAARMTKPKEPDELFQVGVTVKRNHKVRFLGPMMSIDAIGPMVEALNRQILAGERTDWTKAEAYPMTRIEELPV